MAVTQNYLHPRDIRLDGVNLRDATFNSQGIGLTVEYYGVSDFYFSAAYLFNTYPSNLSALANNPLISRRSFSSAGLDQAFGLEDNRTTLGLGYSFSSAMLGAQRSMSVFAVDNSSSTIDTIYLSGNINSQWRAKLSVGKSSSDGVVDDAIFTNVAVTYRW